MDSRGQRGIFKWLTRRINRVVRNMINRALPTGRSNSRGRHGNSRGYAGDRYNEPYNTTKHSKRQVQEEPQEEKVSYIEDVGNFAKDESLQVRPIYQYSAKDGEVKLQEDGEEGMVNEDTETTKDPNEPEDLWETDEPKEAETNQYKERIEEIAKESKDSRKEVLRYYRELAMNTATTEGAEVNNIRQQVYHLLPLDQIEQVPYFLTKGAEIESDIKKAVNSKLTEEGKNQIIEGELKRYRDTIKDFMELTEKDDKFYITDWKLGIKVIDFMVNDCQFPEIMLILSPSGVDEIVRVMRTGYLPLELRETPFEKIVLIFEKLAEKMEKDKGSGKYSFPKAYVSYKQQLPMHKKLRNNGRLANVNAVIGYFYQALDSVPVQGDVEGDAYLGLIEPLEFIQAYVQFFYGRAKQTQAMSDVSLKLMKKDPTILQEVGEKGYALGDTPQGSVFMVTGHVIVMVNVGGDQYNIILDKAPSDITKEDITNITGMFSAERKKAKQAKPKPKSVQQPKKKQTGMSYDYDEAITRFKKDKNTKTNKNKAKKANKGG